MKNLAVLLLVMATPLIGCRIKSTAATLKGAESSGNLDLATWGKTGVCKQHPYNTLVATALSPEELTAVLAYQDTDYSRVNRFLRFGSGPQDPDLLAKLKKEVDLIAESIAIQKPMPQTADAQPLKVYRSYKADGVWAPVPKVGADLPVKGFLSTTFNDQYAAGNVVFTDRDPAAALNNTGYIGVTLSVPAGAHGFVMNSVGAKSMHPDECEVLFAHGATAHVDASTVKTITNNNGTFDITLQSWSLTDDGVSKPAPTAKAAAPTGANLDDQAPPAEAPVPPGVSPRLFSLLADDIDEPASQASEPSGTSAEPSSLGSAEASDDSP